MRKTMKKEVTKTTVTLARMSMKDGQPFAEPMEDEVLIGNVSAEKAQKEIKKKYNDDRVVVFTVQPQTEVYEMNVEDFIQVATIVEQDQEAPQEA